MFDAAVFRLVIVITLLAANGNANRDIGVWLSQHVDAETSSSPVALLEVEMARSYTKADIAYKACKNVLKFGKDFDCQMFTEITKAKEEAEKIPFADVKDTCKLMKKGISQVPDAKRMTADDDVADLKAWCVNIFTFGSGSKVVLERPKPKPQCDSLGCQGARETCECTGMLPATTLTVKVRVSTKVAKGISLDEKACVCTSKNATVVMKQVEKPFLPEKLQEVASEEKPDEEKCVGLSCPVGCELPEASCDKAPFASFCACKFSVPPLVKPCSGHGRLAGPSLKSSQKKCICDDGWHGSQCSIACSGRGTMVNSKCFCDDGFDGIGCENHVCSFHGVRGPVSTHIGGVTLDGESDYVSLGKVARPRVYTIEAWIKPSARQAESAGILFAGDGDSGWGLGFSSGNVFSQISDGVKADGWAIESLSQTNYGTLSGETAHMGWHHVALTDDGTVRRFFRDGQLIGQHENIVKVPSTESEEVDLSIGRWGSCPVGPESSGMCAFSGSIAEVRLWSVARSQEQIIAHLNKCPEQSNTAESRLAFGALKGMWRLNDNAGSVAADSSKEGRHGEVRSGGTATGAKWTVPLILNPPSNSSNSSAPVSNFLQLKTNRWYQRMGKSTLLSRFLQLQQLADDNKISKDSLVPESLNGLDSDGLVAMMTTAGKSSAAAMASQTAKLDATGLPKMSAVQCRCDVGFYGAACEHHRCTGHGIFLNNKCVCSPGFAGADCSYTDDQASHQTCQNGGVWAADGGAVNAVLNGKKKTQFSNSVTGGCICPDEWRGDQCQYAVGADNCSYHGVQKWRKQPMQSADVKVLRNDSLDAPAPETTFLQLESGMNNSTASLHNTESNDDGAFVAAVQRDPVDAEVTQQKALASVTVDFAWTSVHTQDFKVAFCADLKAALNVTSAIVSISGLAAFGNNGTTVNFAVEGEGALRAFKRSVEQKAAGVHFNQLSLVTGTAVTFAPGSDALSVIEPPAVVVKVPKMEAYCECDAQWEGNVCSTHVCNQHGTLVDGECACSPGYSGTRCENVICNGHGVFLDGVCQCLPGWDGADCQHSICNGHGILNHGACVCAFDFDGKDCKTHRCSRNGIWDDSSAPGMCKCDRDYSGKRCDVHKCSKHGYVDADSGKCVCDSGFKGDKCNTVEDDDDKIASILQSRPGVSKQCQCMEPSKHPQYRKELPGFAEGVVTRVHLPQTTHVKGLGYVPAPVKVSLPSPKSGKPSAPQWIAAPDLSPETLATQRVFAAQLASITGSDLAASGLTDPSTAAALTGRLELVMSIVSSGANEPAFPNKAVVANSVAEAAECDASRVTLESVIPEGDHYRVHVIVAPAVGGGKESSSVIINRLDKLINQEKSLKTLASGKLAVLAMNVLPPPEGPQTTSDKRHRPRNVKQIYAALMGLKATVDEASYSSVPKADIRSKQILAKFVQNRKAFESSADSMAARQRLLGALNSKLAYLSGEVQKLHAGAGSTPDDESAEEANPSPGSSTTTTAPDQNKFETGTGRESGKSTLGGKNSEKSRDRDGIASNQDDASSSSTEEDQGKGNSQNGVTGNDDAAKASLKNGNRRQRTRSEAEAAAKTAQWRRKQTASGPQALTAKNKAAMGRKMGVKDLFEDIDQSGAHTGDVSAINEFKAGKSTPDTLRQPTTTSHNAQGSRTLVHGSMLASNSVTCSDHMELSSKGLTNTESVTFRDMRILELGASTSFGIGAPSVALKFVTVSMPADDDTAIVPHGLKNLGSVMSLESILMVNKTTVMGPTNFGPVTFVTASAGLSVNATTMENSPHGYTSDPFWRSGPNAPNYYLWIDRRNVNILRINPQKHLDDSTVKVTIFYSS